MPGMPSEDGPRQSRFAQFSEQSAQLGKGSIAGARPLRSEIRLLRVRSVLARILIRDNRAAASASLAPLSQADNRPLRLQLQGISGDTTPRERPESEIWGEDSGSREGDQTRKNPRLQREDLGEIFTRAGGSITPELHCDDYR